MRLLLILILVTANSIAGKYDDKVIKFQNLTREERELYNKDFQDHFSEQNGVYWVVDSLIEWDEGHPSLEGVDLNKVLATSIGDKITIDGGSISIERFDNKFIDLVNKQRLTNPKLCTSDCNWIFDSVQHKDLQYVIKESGDNYVLYALIDGEHEVAIAELETDKTKQTKFWMKVVDEMQRREKETIISPYPPKGGATTISIQ